MDWRGKIFTQHANPIAVIDIGSNSIRLVVYEDEIRTPSPALNEKLLCGLGRKRTPDGRLNERAVKRALKTLRRFRALCEQTRVKNIYAFATEATRSAKDGAQFIAEAEKCCGVPIRVLSGYEEAQMAAAGIASSFVDADGFVGDLGGGSLEMVNLEAGAMTKEISIPLGSLNLMEIAGKDFAKASAHIDSHLDKVPWLKDGKKRPFYLIGGTWRSVARLHMMETGYPLSVMHHYRLLPADVDKLTTNVLGKPAKVKNLERISRDRREMLPYGLLLLKKLTDRIQPSELVMSAFGVREGMLYLNLPPGERELDPLIAACQDMAGRRARSYDYSGEFYRWTDGLFQGAELAESPEEKRLRKAGCLLSDIGWRGHPDYRGEKALGLIAQSAFVGVDHAGRAYLALSVYYGHERALSGTFTPLLRKLAGPSYHHRAQILGSAARAAFKLSANMPGVLDRTTIGYENNKLVLQLPASLEVLDGESLRQRFKVLAQLLNCEAEIRIEPQPQPAKSLFRAVPSRN